MTAKERTVLKEAGEAFGVTVAQVLDHDVRGDDVMDARAVAAWVLNRRHSYSRMRAARAIGSKAKSPQGLCHMFNRMALRVYERAALRRTVGLDEAVIVKARAA